MGKSPKPLYIVAGDPCLGWEELAKLAKQGHTVKDLMDTDIDWGSVDVILDRRAWRMTNAHKTYLTLAIKEARMLKYDTYEKRADSKTRASVAADLDVSDDKSSSSD